MVILGHFGRFWAILDDFGSVEGPGGIWTMAEGPGKGQLRAWQWSGEGQGPRSGEGSGSISAILGHFGDFGGPGLRSDPNRSGSNRNFPKKPGYG